MSDYNDLLSYRRTIAKRANTRLRALENAKSKITGRNFTYGAYERYASNVLNMDRPRFSESKYFQGNLSELRREIANIERFLDAESSTISGNRNIENARVNTFESKFGISKDIARSADFYEFLNSGILDNKLYSKFSSNTIVKLYKSAREKGRSSEEIKNIILDAFAEYRQKTAKATISDLEERLGIKWE